MSINTIVLVVIFVIVVFVKILKDTKMNKRIQIKHDKQKIQKLEQRIDDLIGMNNELEELIKRYEYEDKNRVNFKNNIYLGTISRVEPSLQAAFVDFGRIKHGFLAFNDIQSDYYQIPS